MVVEDERQGTDGAVDAEDRWLQLGARAKAESVVTLTAGERIKTVLEIGPATGALLEEMSARGVGTDYWACEPAEDLYRALVGKNIPGVRGAECALLSDSEFSQREFDLAVLSHVLEHTLNPAVLLGEALACARLVLVEVPLDGSALGTMRAKLRERVTGRSREENPAGHVTFLSARSATNMVTLAGGEVVRQRKYFPREAYASSPEGGSALKSSLRRAVLALPEGAACVYHAHLALLVRKREPVSYRHVTYYG